MLLLHILSNEDYPDFVVRVELRDRDWRLYKYRAVLAYLRGIEHAGPKIALCDYDDLLRSVFSLKWVWVNPHL